MELKCAEITNFRRLDGVKLEFGDKETIFVGPNNSGKTSATSVFRCFLGRRAFNIYDFPLARLAEIDAFNPDGLDLDTDDLPVLPFIQLDLWFSLEAESVEFARVVSLLSELDEETATVGIGCTLSVIDPAVLWRDYTQMYPANENGERKLTLSEFLALEGHLKRYFSVEYASLMEGDDGVIRHPISPSEGNRTLHSLLRVDFVDAQRNIQDDEENSRGSKLSAAFAAFYKANLRQLEAGDEAVRIVEENNRKLTEHYSESFDELMGILKNLGVPSANERELEIRSILGAEEALKGTTDLFYKDKGSALSLPEAYNGLGFKNLVLMAIQMRDFQMQWANTEEERPLCHVIFVEEPEVHLHAQVQQTFVSNMWAILNDLSEQEGIAPQLVVTTHSSHILNSVDFGKVRYFRRCRRADEDPDTYPLLSISEVHNLGDFRPTEPDDQDEEGEMSANDALNFLKRYMTLTHCDLMFADAAILIEGTVERLLLPAMIRQIEPNLSRAYLTILEVGGAYAHVFAELMRFLHIPYLVVTDIDAVKAPEGGGRPKACRADDENAVTSNTVLKAFFDGKKSIVDLVGVTPEEQIQEDGNRFVTFQRPQAIAHGGASLLLHGRTLEEAFIYENLSAFGVGGSLFDLSLPNGANEIGQFVFDLVRRSTFKKTEFALGILAGGEEAWATPAYIAEGLSWLAQRLEVKNEEAPGENGA